MDGGTDGAAREVFGVNLGNWRVDDAPPGIPLGLSDLMLRLEFIVVFVEDGDVLVEEVCRGG